MVKFKLRQVAESVAEFDTAEKLDSRLIPYLWQGGLSYYCAAWAEGAKQFKTHILHHSQEQARCLLHNKIHSSLHRHLACS